MNRIVAAALALSAGVALAQEIGTEIPEGTTPPASTGAATPAPYDNPYAPPPATPPAAEPAKPEAKPASPGPRKGAFGLNASFGGSGVPVLITTAGAFAPTTPTVGLRYMATDSLAVDFDVGLGISTAMNTPFGFGIGFGIDAYLGSAEKPLRPYFAGRLGFGKLFSSRADDFAITEIGLGGGAEYWLSEHFSLHGEALVGLGRVDFSQSTVSITLATISPGLGATFYF